MISEVSKVKVKTSLIPSLLLQVLGVYLFSGSFIPHDQPVEVFVIILSCSLFLTPLAYISRRRQWQVIAEMAFFLRLLVILVVAIPLGLNRWPSFLLVLSLIVDVAVLHGHTVSILVISGVIALDFINMGEHLVWGASIPAIPWSLRLALLGGYLIMTYYILLAIQNQRLVQRIGIEKDRLSETVERLSEAGEGFLSFASSAEQKSTEKERQRLTREIHDTAGYTLTNIRMMMEAGLRNKEMDREELDKLFSWTLDQSLNGLQDLRSILGLIREKGESQVRGVKSLAQVGSVFQYATGIEVNFEWGNVTERWMEGDRDLLVLRIVQEGLTNAFRHGMATNVNITFFQDEDCVRMGIHDNGYGASSIDLGIGLSGMKERLAAIDGELQIPSNLPGFQINIMIPLLNTTNRSEIITKPVKDYHNEQS